MLKKTPWASDLICLNTDIKPTADISEGSTLVTVDFATKKVEGYFMFHDGYWYSI